MEYITKAIINQSTAVSPFHRIINVDFEDKVISVGFEYQKSSNNISCRWMMFIPDTGENRISITILHESFAHIKRILPPSEVPFSSLNILFDFVCSILRKIHVKMLYIQDMTFDIDGICSFTWRMFQGKGSIYETFGFVCSENIKKTQKAFISLPATYLVDQIAGFAVFIDMFSDDTIGTYMTRLHDFSISFYLDTIRQISEAGFYDEWYQIIMTDGRIHFRPIDSSEENSDL